MNHAHINDVSSTTPSCAMHTHTHTHTLQVYDLGGNGLGMSKVTSMSMAEIAHRAAVSLHSSDKSLFKPLISISVIPTSDSSTLHLLAVSQAGRSRGNHGNMSHDISPPPCLCKVCGSISLLLLMVLLDVPLC